MEDKDLDRKLEGWARRERKSEFLPGDFSFRPPDVSRSDRQQKPTFFSLKTASAAAVLLVFAAILSFIVSELGPQHDNRADPAASAEAGLSITEGYIPVKFVLNAPDAEQVEITGDFTSWKPLQLKRGANGAAAWEITIPLKKGETYIYNFVLDGEEWIIDPAKQTTVKDDFGGKSTLIQL